MFFYPQQEVKLERREVIGKSNTAFLEWYDAFLARYHQPTPVLKLNVDYFIVNGVIKLADQTENKPENQTIKHEPLDNPNPSIPGSKS